MREIRIEFTLDSWRRAARLAIAKGLPPEEIRWRESREPTADPGLFDPPPTPPPDAAASNEATDLRVPRAFLALAESVIASPDADRWRLLYSVLWRIAAGDRDLLLRRGDPDLQRLREIAVAQPADRADGSTDPDGAASFVPPGSDLSQLAKAAASCRGCDLYRHATQTVFGKGPATAQVVLVGEAPGDQEDLRGAPFVGPAGEVLDRALQAAGLSRDAIYVTNAVKHFKFVRTPTRRIHQTPGSSEIEACRPWLAAELAVLSPRVLVCLGATAAKALFSPDFRLMKQRGRFLDSALAPKVLATFHPSAVLRAEDEAGRARVFDALVADLSLAAGALSARD